MYSSAASSFFWAVEEANQVDFERVADASVRKLWALVRWAWERADMAA